MMSAPSGAGKSSVLREMVAPLRDIEEYLREVDPEFGGIGDPGGGERDDRLGRSSSLSVLLSFSAGKEGRGSRKRLRRLICEDVTAPALAVLLAENRETTFNVSTEAGNLLDRAGSKSNELGQLLLKGYSGDPVDIDRITRDAERLESPCISLFWLCQPNRLDNFLSRDHLIEDGLIARFLVAHSDARMTPLEDEVPEIPVSVKDAYGALIGELFDHYHILRGGTRTVALSPGGSAVLKEYHNDCAARTEDELFELQPCVARWPEQARRLGLVLHAAEHGGRAHEHPLTEETVRAAVSLAQWFSEQQLAILGRMANQRIERYTEKLFSLLEKSTEGKFSIRNLKNSHGFTDDQIEEIVKRHPDRLELQYLQNPKGGRPSRIVVLVPTVRNAAVTSFRVRR